MRAARGMVAGAALALLSVPTAWGLDFRSIAVNAAVLYDAPSAKARKMYVVNEGYPLEVVVMVEGWVKVRDANGDLTWVERKALSERRTVMVKVALAPVRQAADEASPIVFEAQQSVILELEDVAGAWLKVKHRDGQSGYIKAADVWGA